MQYMKLKPVVRERQGISCLLISSAGITNMSEKNISIGNILGCILLTVSAAAQSNGALAPPDTTKRIPTLETPAIAPELVKKIDQLSFEEIGRMQRKLSDWPQLSRYHDENAIVGSVFVILRVFYIIHCLIAIVGLF